MKSGRRMWPLVKPQRPSLQPCRMRESVTLNKCGIWCRTTTPRRSSTRPCTKNTRCRSGRKISAAFGFALTATARCAPETTTAGTAAKGWDGDRDGTGRGQTGHEPEGFILASRQRKRHPVHSDRMHSAPPERWIVFLPSRNSGYRLKEFGNHLQSGRCPKDAYNG